MGRKGFQESCSFDIECTLSQPHRSLRRSSQRSVGTQGSRNSITSLRNAVSATDPVTQQKRKLKAVLGDLKQDSDAPPAVRRLVTVVDEEECDDYDDYEPCAIGASATAPPTPLGQPPRRGSHSAACEKSVPCCSICQEVINPFSGHGRDSEQSADGDTQGAHDANLNSLEESPTMLSLIPRVRSSYSSSKLSACLGGGLRARGSDLLTLHSVSAGVPRRRRHSFCCQRAPQLLLASQTREEKEVMVQRSKNSSNDTLRDRPDPVFLFKPLGLLDPVLFAASYPIGDAPDRLRIILGETPSVDKSDSKRETAKVESDAAVPLELNKVKLLPLDEGRHHQRIKTRESESGFSLSTPRRQSTSSSLHYSATVHASRQTFLRSPRAQQQQQYQQQQQQQYRHSRAFSFSRASSEKTLRSPTASSTFRQWPSESIEWLQQHLILQQAHVCHLPAFTSGGGSGDGGDSGIGLHPPWHSTRFGGDTNNVSSVLLTRTTSNVDTLPTCCDAPLDTFMESSSLAASSTLTTLV
ncbi:hypothetical protein DQ04_05931010 [Trypanosoma grayi]|uniref:hypothetical protein n=1 Tax=Trypanosoma grayi TaxID=71804 RepID=UPI0004F4149F|nr:hypothetical protein DQ04_05931010 [Trypanosoma grayi]KEG09041.1 hypothetical protein DQ04_05931010 [Trypanosoma grayi]